MRLNLLSLAILATFGLTACNLNDRKSETTPSSAQASAPVPVKLIAFNDFHGNLESPGEVTIPDPKDSSKTIKVKAGGVDYLAATIASLRAKSANSVVVSAGDLVGASPLVSALFHDEPTIEAMNALGLDLNAVGNHEFDDGQDELVRLQQGGCKAGSTTTCQNGGSFSGAKFKFLAANVQKTDGKTLFPAYEIRKFDGISVAFIGMTLKGTPAIVAPAGIKGLSFGDEAETVNKLVPELKKQGVEAIVVVVHEGGLQTGKFNECVGISGAIVDIVKKFDKAVDLVVTGHTHRAYNCEIDGRRVTSAHNYGQMYSEIDFKLDPSTRDIDPKSIVANNRVVTQDITPLPAVSSLVDTYKKLAAPISLRVVGQLQAKFDRSQNAAGESTLGDLIADAQLASGKTEGAVVALMNPGGLRADLIPDANNNVNYSQLFSSQPFGNIMTTLNLTGEQIDQLLEQQWLDPNKTKILQVSAGFSYSYSKSAPVGSKVDIGSIKIDGVAIDPKKTYRITANNFIAEGGDGFTVLAQGTQRVGGGLDVEVLEAYLKAHSPLALPVRNRITQLP